MVLEFDFEFRKRFTWCFNNRNQTLKQCMTFAMDDVANYQIHFLNPLSMAMGAAAARAPLWTVRGGPAPPGPPGRSPP